MRDAIRQDGNLDNPDLGCGLGLKLKNWKTEQLNFPETSRENWKTEFSRDMEGGVLPQISENNSVFQFSSFPLCLRKIQFFSFQMYIFLMLTTTKKTELFLGAKHAQNTVNTSTFGERFYFFLGWVPYYHISIYKETGSKVLLLSYYMLQSTERRL